MHKSFSEANALFRAGRFEEALRLYSDLAQSHDLKIYRDAVTLTRMKLRREASRSSDLNAVASTAESKWLPNTLIVTAGLKGPTPGGGIATCLDSMIRRMLDIGIRVSVLYAAHPYYSRENYKFWREHYLANYGVELYGLTTNKKNYGSQEMQRSFSILKYLEESAYLYDRIIFHDYMGLAYYPLMYRKLIGFFSAKELIITAHGNHTLSYYFGQKKFKTWSERVAAYMERESLKLADVITVPSEYYGNWLRSNFGIENVRLLPNMIEVPEVSRASDDEDSKSAARNLFVFYGRLERLKGLDIFMDALLGLPKNFDGSIWFAGNNTTIDGQTADKYIKEKLKERKLNIKFHFNVEVFSFLELVKKNKGVCIFPTLGETSSCVVVECVKTFTPFLVSDIPGIKELIKPKFQKKFMFEAGSSNALLEKIIAKDFYTPTSDVLAHSSNHLAARWDSFFTERHGTETLTSRLAFDKRIAVVIPTADRPEMLEECLESFRGQRYKHFEIFVGDDSSDSRAANESLCDRYGVSYRNFDRKLYKGSVCNEICKTLNHDYFLFFDDDDIAKPEMIQTYIQALVRCPDIEILSCFADYFDHGRREESGELILEYTSLALGGGLEVNFHINMFGKGTFLVRRDVFQGIQGYEHDDFQVPMVDYRFYLKAALSGHVSVVIPQALYYYRKNSPSSLFYSLGSSRRSKYYAKASIERLIERRLGSDMAKAFSPMLWDVSMPVYE